MAELLATECWKPILPTSSRAHLRIMKAGLDMVLIKGGQSVSLSGAASLHICNLPCSLTDAVLGSDACAVVKYIFITDKAMHRVVLL